MAIELSANGFSPKEAAKVRSALREVERRGECRSKRMQEALWLYDLITSMGPPRADHPDESCRRYNHHELTERGVTLLANLNTR